MAFGSFEQNNQPPMSEINTTPMVDVMLVLLIIFMITAPLMTQSIGVNLPTAEGSATAAPPQIIHLEINAREELLWNGEKVDDNGLTQCLTELAANTPQPELHLFADKSVRYERVAQVMARVRDAGITKMGFVMQAGGALE